MINIRWPWGDQLEDAHPREWHALPGGQIELADTGFLITFLPSDGSDYILYTPEGRRLASCTEGQLDSLKLFAEKCARQREEFIPPKPTWP